MPSSASRIRAKARTASKQTSRLSFTERIINSSLLTRKNQYRELHGRQLPYGDWAYVIDWIRKRDFILDNYQEDDETLRIDLHGVHSLEFKTAIYVRNRITEDEFEEWDRG